jgi:hypothetical protein
MPAIRKLKFRVKKTITLQMIANQLAQDFIGAIYSAIGSKSIANLNVGDELTDVVDQYLDKSGMSEEMNRMSTTKIRVNVGIDCSVSMWSRYNGKPIVRASVVMRTLMKAFRIVQEQLPADVFDYSLWLWACGRSGSRCVCLTDEGYDTLGFPVMQNKADETIDRLLESIAGNEPSWSGSGTQLAPMLEMWTRWQLDRGQPGTHTLDIVVTDGELGDVQEASHVQLFRQTGKYIAMMLTVGNAAYTAPDGFLSYAVRVDEMEGVIRNTLMDFVQTMY